MKKMINFLLTASMLTSCITAPVFTGNAAVQVSETEEKPIISEKLKNDIDAGLEKIDVMMWCTFKIDYSKIIPEVNKATEEYENSLDKSIYTDEELTLMIGTFKNDLSQKMYEEAYAVKTKEVCDFIGIDISEANFTGTGLRCTLTPEQIYKIAGTELVKGRVIEQCEFVSADDLGYHTVDATDNNEKAEKAAELFSKYFTGNNLDAKVAEKSAYPDYMQPVIIEYNTQTVQNGLIIKFAEENNIDRSLFTLIPVINGMPMTTANPNANITTTTTEAEPINGDANCDNELSMADAVLIMQSIANPAKFGIEGTDENHITEQGKKNADITGENDGITNADALAIQKKLLKLD